MQYKCITCVIVLCLTATELAKPRWEVSSFVHGWLVSVLRAYGLIGGHAYNKQLA